MTKSAAYQKGAVAYRAWLLKVHNGHIKKTPKCPYERSTQEYEDWHEGYNDAAEAKWQGQ